MSICNRKIIQIQNQLNSLPGLLDINDAGLSIYFLFITTALYYISLLFSCLNSKYLKKSFALEDNYLKQRFKLFQNKLKILRQVSIEKNNLKL